ncbi:MAG: helix-turn-helix domain-containing protein [Oscillospiraceae bacterium]|jgi:AraC-like DNA-binding protein|nr:helix-turn-helix domain-containing protein [Oscillospiraceae bacterium]
MIVADVLRDLQDNSPPFQPLLNIRVRDYREKAINWNGVGIKKGALCYQFRSSPDPELCQIRILPDACSNVFIECGFQNPDAIFSGAFFEPKMLTVKPDTEYFGFKPYSNLGLKCEKFKLSELADSAVSFCEAYPMTEELLAQMRATGDFEERIRLFCTFADRHMTNHDYDPTFIDYFTVMICSSRGNVLFNNMRQVTGYSERYCRERFKEVHGCSPKQYSGVMRFQSVLKDLLKEKDVGVSSLVFNNGYFDQAHLIRDFKRFAMMPPDRFRRTFRSARARAAALS